MSEVVERLKTFVQYAAILTGDEKGEAQVFCDRLFQGFGHQGYKEAGATLEFRLKKKRKAATGFADLVWPGRLLIEMKRRGEGLQLHYPQAFDNWIHAVPNRPRYVVLCNFDEFWIYDFDKQIDEPVDIVSVIDLPKRYTALNFLFPEDRDPIFGNDREGVTREAADHIADIFNSLVKRGTDRGKAQLFVLQSVVALFAEDMDLLPRGLVHKLVEDCRKGANSYDLFGGLFRQMNTEAGASAGRYKDVPYFNGGLYGTIDPVELSQRELALLGDAASKDWSKVNPAIFGTLFQGSMDVGARHAYGAHYTSEADILRVVQPTIVRPWQDRIVGANSMKDLLALRTQMLAYRVLDPACGSGNFLYVAYRELARLEITLLLKLRSLVSGKEFARNVKTLALIGPRQFFGIDRESFGIELAKVTLMLAKKLALDEATLALEREQIDLDLHEDHAIPLDNLDANFTCGDALLVQWPKVDAIIGNPPFQSKNKMQAEFGRAYLNGIRERYPEIPGRADYCVYWFRRAHDELSEGKRAGLVGTNTIRQTYSRVGGLDYIVANGGTITEAVATQVWSGDAAVHVSIVNWIKGAQSGKRRLSWQRGDLRDSPWSAIELPVINSSLSAEVDLSRAVALEANARTGGCFQGQTHGHEGFLLSAAEAEVELHRNSKASAVLFPYLTADELLGEKTSLPTRFVIDFYPRDLLTSQSFRALFDRIEREVLPDRKSGAREEETRNNEARAHDPNARVNRHHQNFLAKWWLLSYPREEMIAAIRKLSRYVVCGRVTKRPIFEFLSSRINPNDALMVFPYDDDYSFGLLQSGIHWSWFVNRCSTLKGDFRYTSNTVFDTFPWPQAPAKGEVLQVAEAAAELRKLRRSLMKKHKLSLRELYRSLEKPGKHLLNAAQDHLDEAVRMAYGMPKKQDPLVFLLDLNEQVAVKQAEGEQIVGPGLPLTATKVEGLVTADCIEMP